jgi:hypothetical protein
MYCSAAIEGEDELLSSVSFSRPSSHSRFDDFFLTITFISHSFPFSFEVSLPRRRVRIYAAFDVDFLRLFSSCFPSPPSPS